MIFLHEILHEPDQLTVGFVNRLLKSFARQDREEAFREIDPARVRRRVVETDLWVFLQPCFSPTILVPSFRCGC